MKDVEVWSCGGGTQSGAIAELIKQGRLPRPDMAFMTDTGRERSATWPFVDGFIRPRLASVGLELTIVPAEDFARIQLMENGVHLLPGFTNLSGNVGKLRPFCSGHWKRDVGMRYLRSIGVESAVNWIGISVDEMHRVRTPKAKWLQLRYPLIYDVPMRRWNCVELIRSTDWRDKPIPRSACWMCPNHNDSEWIDMRINWPDDFRSACDLEKQLRETDENFFLHESCVPLGEVDFSAQRTLLASQGCVGECFT
jgi:hypothetical protein